MTIHSNLLSEILAIIIINMFTHPRYGDVKAAAKSAEEELCMQTLHIPAHFFWAQRNQTFPGPIARGVSAASCLVQRDKLTAKACSPTDGLSAPRRE